MIAEYRENRKIIAKLNNQVDKKREEADQATQKIRSKYQALKNKLHEEETKEMDDIATVFNEEKSKFEQVITEKRKIIDQVKRILLLKKIAKKHPNPCFEVKSYRDKDIEVIESLVKTSCIDLRVYVYGNSKPKNKYTLAVIGNSIFVDFDHKLIDLPCFYSLGLNDHQANVRIWLKDNSTVESLKEYYHKNKGKLLNEILAKHAKLELEYQAVQKNNNTQEWEQLYWENEKQYYENHVCGGTETEEYEAILSELAKLN